MAFRNICVSVAWSNIGSGAQPQQAEGKGLRLSQIQKNPYAERLNIGLGRRALALLATLFSVLALLALLLTFGPVLEPRGESRPIQVVTINAPQAAAEDAAAAEPQPSTSPTPDQPRPETPPQPSPTPPRPAEPQPFPPPILPPANPTVQQPAPFPPRTPPAQVYGPPDRRSSASRDTPRVGTAPNGEPMYAAAWYREPTDGELAGYLSTASGPAWGLIACRTAPDFRVEDCVGLEEYPAGSQMNRAILAAAWQFRVRPPRLGGRVMVGSWVRIRIDYRDRGR